MAQFIINGTHTCADTNKQTPARAKTRSLTPTTQGERSVHFKDGTTITCDCPNDRILNLFWVCLCMV